MTKDMPQGKQPQTQELLYDKRDEVWEKVNAETLKFGTAELLERLLAADIWCAEVKDIRRAA